MSGRSFAARDARAVMAPGRPAPAAPRRTGAGGLCRAFAPARVLLGTCRCLLAGRSRGPGELTGSLPRCRAGAATGQKGCGMGPAGRLAMAKAGTGSRSPVLEEAARELEAAAHDARVAVDCLALGELDRAHTSALTARVAADAAVTALQAALLAAGTAAGS